ncbi:MAG: potassium transporter [Paramuribaculum sp.]|nr:potassium transporter [Paramuribaculum sp.]
MPIKTTFIRQIRAWFKLRQKRLDRALIRGSRAVGVIGDCLMNVSIAAAFVCVIGLIVYAGFDHTDAGYRSLRRLMQAIQWIFAVNVLYGLTLNLREILRQSRPLRWFVDIILLVSLLPAIYPHPVNPWIPVLERILYSPAMFFGALSAYSAVTLSFGLYRVFDRRTNPSLLLSLSFAAFIVIGTLLIMLPKCTTGGISLTDAFFVSTSAVCVTGLTPVDISSTFTPLGLGILAILIQFGALGVMTFTSFFALFFSGNASIYSQLMLRDVIYSKSMNSLIPTLLYIMAATFGIELCGAALIFWSIHGSLGMTVPEEIVFSGFHSLSAFCNAGFSNLPDGMSNPLLLGRNMSIYWIMTLLIISGSIGFPILVNTKDAAAQEIRRRINRLRHKPETPRTVHLFNMNTKIVIFTFSFLFISGAALFFILEYSNSLAGMSLCEKITQSVFNSAVPRSAGFSSVNPARFLNVTLIAVLFLMWAGGGSQSTGGGIKVNTLAVIWLNLRAIVTGTPRVTAYKRTIAVGSIRRANAVVAISIFSYFLLSFLLLGLEPALPARMILFESCSALFTVGSSLGATPLLSIPSKLLLCVAMFLGRVGIISLLMGLVRKNPQTTAHYPSDSIIIN